MNCADDKQRAAVEYLKGKRIIATPSLVQLVLAAYDFAPLMRRDGDKLHITCSRCGREWKLSKQQLTHPSTMLAIRSHRIATRLCDQSTLSERGRGRNEPESTK